MASTFPTALDTIPNSPTTEKLGESAPKHSEMHDALRDAIVAAETRIGGNWKHRPGIAHVQALCSGRGSAVSALADKSTPVDADLVALSDSAAGGVLKRNSPGRTSRRFFLQSVCFATLAGVAGGQSLWVERQQVRR